MSDGMSEWIAQQRDKKFDFPATLPSTSAPKETAKPAYYLLPSGSVDIGDVVAALPFWVAQAMKYLYRHEHKGQSMNDLYKAQECITREIARRIRTEK